MFRHLLFWQIMFRFALALFKYKEEEFLKLQDPMTIFKYLRYFTRTILDARCELSMDFCNVKGTVHPRMKILASLDILVILKRRTQKKIF